MREFDATQIRKIDGGLLLIFRELLARRQASAVASELGLSPSAISHALNRLRDVFEDPLFIRKAHGFEPTRRALRLAPKIQALVEAIGDSLEGEKRFDPVTSRRRFRIGFANAMDSVIGPGLVKAFRAHAPEAVFAMREAFLESAVRAVLLGELDLALGVFDDLPAGLKKIPLFDDDYCVIARRGHPALAEHGLTLKVYAETGHVFVGTLDGALPREDLPERAKLDEAYGFLPKPGLIRTHAYVSRWETAMFIVAESDALAECPRSLAVRRAARLGLEIHEPPFAPMRLSVAAIRRTDGIDDGVDWLIEQLVALVAR